MGQLQIDPMYFQFCVIDTWVICDDKIDNSMLFSVNIDKNRRVNFVIIDSLEVNNTKLKVHGVSLQLTQTPRVFLQFSLL